MAPSLSNVRTGSDLSEDGSRGGRRVRPRAPRATAGAPPADSALNGSMSTVTDLRTLTSSGQGSTLGHGHRGVNGDNMANIAANGSHLLGAPSDSNNGSSFQPFHSSGGASAGNSGGFAPMPISAGMQPDWISMAAAAGQQQV